MKMVNLISTPRIDIDTISQIQKIFVSTEKFLKFTKEFVERKFCAR
jgi:hypothetical protein